MADCSFYGELTKDPGFKFFFKDPSLKSYVATIISDMLKLDYNYTLENMRYLDIEFPKGINSLMRSDVVIKINNTILIFEMNRTYYKDLVELKIRYSNHIFDKMFYKVGKEYRYNKTKIILVMINAFDNDIATSTYKPLNEYARKLTEYLEVKEYNLAKIREIWYNEFTISKSEKCLLYLLMTREKEEKIKEYVKGDEILSEAEKNRIDLMNGKICLDYDVEIENEIVKQGLLEAGRADGKKEEKKEIATNMKKNGISSDLISKVTGLTKKQIALL